LVISTASDTNVNYRLCELVELQKKKKSVSNFNCQANPADESGVRSTPRVVGQDEEYIVINPQGREEQSKIRYGRVYFRNAFQSSRLSIASKLIKGSNIRRNQEYFR
jgi:hypothetical protein